LEESWNTKHARANRRTKSRNTTTAPCEAFEHASYGQAWRREPRLRSLRRLERGLER
jgi:hypothetical protein